MGTSAKPHTVWFGMEITPEQRAKIRRLAQKEGITAKDALLRLVDRALDESGEKSRTGPLLDGIEHLVGSVEGPRDLSTNPNHMRGLGR